MLNKRPSERTFLAMDLWRWRPSPKEYDIWQSQDKRVYVDLDNSEEFALNNVCSRMLSLSYHLFLIVSPDKDQLRRLSRGALNKLPRESLKTITRDKATVISTNYRSTLMLATPAEAVEYLAPSINWQTMSSLKSYLPKIIYLFGDKYTEEEKAVLETLSIAATQTYEMSVQAEKRDHSPAGQ